METESITKDLGATTWRGRVSLFLVAGLLVAVHAFVEIRHEPWRDEFQQWLLVRASGGPWSLLQHLRYEGHPIAWYLCLLALSKFTGSIAAVKTLGILVSSLTGVLILRYAPFRLWQRIAVVAGYFAFYEYGTIVRGYTLGLLLLVLLFMELRRDQSRLPVIIGLCALCFFTSVHTGVVAFAVAGAAMWPSLRKFPASRIGGVLLAALLIVVAYLLQVFRAVSSGEALQPFSAVMRGTVIGIFPLPLLQKEFWNTSLFDATPDLMIPLGILGVAVIAYTLRSKLNLMFGWLAGVAALVTLEVVQYAGMGDRHFGHFFLLFLGLLWIGWGSANEARQDQARRVFAVLLIAQLVTGAWAVVTDAIYPFTGAAHAASWLRSHPAPGEGNQCLMGNPEYRLTSVAGRLNMPYYSIGSQRFLTYETWKGQVVTPVEQTGRQAQADLQMLDCNPTLVSPYVVPDAQESGWHLVASFTNSIRADERYWIYRR